MYKFLRSEYNRIRGVKRMKKTYTIIVHKEEEGFWAECPELEGCFAQAKTIEELKHLMTESIYLYFDEEIEKAEKEIKESAEIELELSYA